MKRILLLLAACLLAAATPARAGFIDEQPSLSKLLFSEADSNLRLGFGVSPLGIMKNKASYALSVFQVHRTTEWIDWELFNASYGTTLSGSAESNLKLVTLRTAPKLRVFKGLSVGPVAGIEFVSFPDINSRLGNGVFFTPAVPFSTQGWIYGAAISEEFRMGANTPFKATQLVYRQVYSTTRSSREGWDYYYDTAALNADSSPIGPSWVFLIEFSMLY
jgi:hypothetical protein